MAEEKKRIAIMQPGYLPWLGFFELMYNCDLFVFLDDVQYTKRDWRNRNRIRTHNGWQWLTVPAFNRNKREQLLKNVQINNQINWQKQHFNALRINYRKSKFFDSFSLELESIYFKSWDNLLELNIELILYLAKMFSIETPYIFSSSLNIKNTKSERILEICKLLNANELYDSKAASNFLDLSLFEKEKITVKFQDYRHPVYEQVYKPFIAYLSAIDLLFNCGAESLKIILGE
ncbi:MAG: WbqC family protein [Candidatus Omnitrophica bacterium]|nr:WbqC family protein [Candidatus Omnitrophota bacterium]